MNNLAARLQRLEATNGLSGPLVLSWELDDPEKRATTEHGGKRYTQEPGEGRAAFLSRLGQSIPAGSFVWMDQLKDRL